jgi:DNA-binding transcriptional ArsR family regulator
MTSTIDSLAKVLKDETRRKIIIALKEKGSLTYTDLMESLDILSTGTLNYHLKVLGDLLEKDETERYVLSEKGKLASRLLTDFPGQNYSTPNMRRLKFLWFFSAIIFTVTGFVIWYGMNVPIYRLIYVIIVAQLSAAFFYYIRSRPEKTGRIFWIAIGVFVIGGALWLALQGFMKETGFRLQLLGLTGNTGDDLFALISFIVLWSLGGFVGDRIGKKLHYRVLLYQGLV